MSLFEHDEICRGCVYAVFIFGKKREAFDYCQEGRDETVNHINGTCSHKRDIDPRWACWLTPRERQTMGDTMKPVGYAHKHDLEGMADGDSFAVIEPACMDDKFGVPLYTADQIREVVERVRAEAVPRPWAGTVDHKPYRTGKYDALDALLREFNLEERP